MIPQAQLDALSDVDVLALTLWAESRSESLEGRVAVACVVRNRMRLRKLTAKQVCLAPMQFACWQEIGGKANHAALAALVAGVTGRPKRVSDPILIECYWIAEGVLDGELRDIAKGADHYITTALLASDHKPGWVRAMTWVATVGSHAFYRS